MRCGSRQGCHKLPLSVATPHAVPGNDHELRLPSSCNLIIAGSFSLIYLGKEPTQIKTIIYKMEEAAN